MKVVRSVVLLITIFFAATFAYPANEPAALPPSPAESSTSKSDDRIEVDFVPLEEGRRPGAPFVPNGVIDIDANPGTFLGNPFYDTNPFPSLFESFNALMYRMRQQLGHLLGRLPDRDANFPELHIPNVGNIDLGKGNTTSVTKVIDGHKVTINETEYKQEGDNGGSYFKVRVIDVHPDSAEGTDKPLESPINKDRESMEDSNEILKVKDNEALKSEDIEAFDEVDAAGTHHAGNRHWTYTKPLENVEDNSINSELVPPPDLSNDIYVNQLLMNSGAPTNSDAEVFEVLNGQLPPPKKTEGINYDVPHRNDFESNEPARDFHRVGLNPAFTHNMPFIPQPMYPVNQVVSNMPPSNFYVGPSNFPIFPVNQMYFPQGVPVEQNFPPSLNSEIPLPNYSAIDPKGTTQIHDLSTSNVVSTQTGPSNPSSTS
ncbi:hypothetical protein FQR65_LT01674 [Abscondita terminalis]|nr:hypothetical protein FQR65_LT01674 [Abscondita terminalis]